MRRIIFDTDIKKCSDLENRVTGLSRSLEMSSFDRVHTTSYRRCIVMLCRALIELLALTQKCSFVF